MRVCGIDEAGKGAVIGPLIVAGICLDSSLEQLLWSWGVRDSKLLSPSARMRLYSILTKNLEYATIQLSPAQIDQLRSNYTLNQILADCYTELVKKLNPELVYLDCPSPNIPKYLELIRSKLGRDLEIKAQHRAELSYSPVAAASIIAKVERDQAIRELERRLGARIGSGYPSDPATLKFIREHGIDPSIMRISWATLQRGSK